MSYVRGSIPHNLFLQESFSPLIKKCDDYRKSTQKLLSYFNVLIQIFERQFTINSKALLELKDLDKVSCPEYYRSLREMFIGINIQNKTFSEKAGECYRETTNCFHAMFLDMSNCLLNFQQHMQNYDAAEQNINSMIKRYIRSLKVIEASIQFYKQALADAKLIYNESEKTKRYQLCETQYDKIVLEYQQIQEKVEILDRHKKDIHSCYGRIQGELMKIIKAVGIKNVSDAKLFVQHTADRVKIILNKFLQAKKEIAKGQFTNFFYFYKQQINPQLFSCEIQQKDASFIPPLITYYQYVKDEQVLAYNESLLRLIEQTDNLLEDRKGFNIKIIEFIQGYAKNLRVNLLGDMKEAMMYFEKMRKTLVEAFGTRIVLFMKSINHTFELTISIHEKLIKKIAITFGHIKSDVWEYNKSLDSFYKQLKGHIEKLLNRKQIRGLMKSENSRQSKQLKEGEPNELIYISMKQIQKFRTHMHSSMRDLIKLYSSFREKLDKIDIRIKRSYQEFIEAVIASQLELSDLLQDSYNNYFSKGNFCENIKLFQGEMGQIHDRERIFFQNLKMGDLLKDSAKVTYEGEKHKFQEFKRLKKPNMKYRESMAQEQGLSTQINLPFQLSERESSWQKKEAPEFRQKNKYEDMLRTKVQFKQGEHVIDFFNCVLCDKINLHGKIFITSERMCFYSKFNAATLFFGGTFLQIPMSDIQKVQKRRAFFVNNSILLTTINGEIFFTQFFNRDAAYKLICETSEINSDELFLEDPLEAQAEIENIVELPLDDDITQEQAITRTLSIQKAMDTAFAYKEVYRSEIENVDSFKLFKGFVDQQEIIVSKRNFKSFYHYLKDSLGHSEILIGDWNPPLKDYLNPITIKSNSPDVFERKITSVVPIKSNGVPFMPKTVESEEVEKLYIFSREKWIIEAKLLTFGAPYTDCFEVYVRTKVENHGENHCTFVVQIFLNFVKNTMMKSLIEAKSEQEVIAYAKKKSDEIRKWIKNAQKLKHKGKGGSHMEELLEDFQREKGELTEANEKLEESLELKTQGQQKFKAFLAISFAVNIVLVIILLI